MTIISTDETRLVSALNLAEDMFWCVIFQQYPEAHSGDLSPNKALGMSAAMRSAVVEWLEFNVDEPEELKTAEILLHRIEYSYDEWDSLTITDSDIEHIAYCISEGISEGELNSEVPAVLPTEMVRGYWKINNNPA